ncbi:MAG: DUF4333 domain-containing protein [Nocardioides sp.]
MTAPRKTAKLPLLLGLMAVAALAAGCSSTPTVEGDRLEGEVSTQLEQSVGVAPDAVDCPDDLEGEEGSSVRCTLTAGSDTVGLTVTVTGVDGDNVDFDIEVDDAVQGDESS